ncbi:MAG: hypothetical protein ACREOB_09825 [Thermodesulfobacteriota bacterium]
MSRPTNIAQSYARRQRVLSILERDTRAVWRVTDLAKAAGITEPQMYYWLKNEFNDLLIKTELYGLWEPRGFETKEQQLNRLMRGRSREEKLRWRTVLLDANDMMTELEELDKKIADYEAGIEKANKELSVFQDERDMLDKYHKEAIADMAGDE